MQYDMAHEILADQYIAEHVEGSEDWTTILQQVAQDHAETAAQLEHARLFDADDEVLIILQRNVNTLREVVQDINHRMMQQLDDAANEQIRDYGLRDPFFTQQVEYDAVYGLGYNRATLEEKADTLSALLNDPLQTMSATERRVLHHNRDVLRGALRRESTMATR